MPPMLAATLFLTAVLGADPVPNYVKTLFETFERDRRAQLTTIKAEVPELEKKLKSRSTVLAARQRIAELHAKMKKLQAAKPYYAELGSLQRGDCGIYPRNMKVVQVVGDGEMLCELTIDGNDELVWVSGVSTKNLADDDLATVPATMVFIVTGNKSYSTAIGGTKTVMRLHAENMKQYEEQGEKIQAAVK